ncbi:hypothetical protein JL101_027710 [Skermanella rosea]|uniref:Uncharacterized protein n=1 Tax=Skermanella cutis TaxID=2775420 RepID=A0ABX7B5C0_9PROT|nr:MULTISPECIES: hypothetical protein [Skermanella]QQP89545.1 hypothetical protein IGS68_26855 [Skermanella sp. TT6]UEM03690.1 hypothetical protein JL101_027710 [Skermanella rosea]
MPAIDEYRIIHIPLTGCAALGRIYGLEGVPDGIWHLTPLLSRLTDTHIHTVTGEVYRTLEPCPSDRFHADDALIEAAENLFKQTGFGSAARTVATIIDTVALIDPMYIATEEELAALRRRAAGDD